MPSRPARCRQPCAGTQLPASSWAAGQSSCPLSKALGSFPDRPHPCVPASGSSWAWSRDPCPWVQDPVWQKQNAARSARLAVRRMLRSHQARTSERKATALAASNAVLVQVRPADLQGPGLGLWPRSTLVQVQPLRLGWELLATVTSPRCRGAPGAVQLQAELCHTGCLGQAGIQGRPIQLQCMGPGDAVHQGLKAVMLLPADSWLCADSCAGADQGPGHGQRSTGAVAAGGRHRGQPGGAAVLRRGADHRPVCLPCAER